MLVLLLALLLVAGQSAPLPPCDRALPPGEGFGGTVTITADCVWRPQLHFISTLSGEQRDYPGPLEAPIIYFEPAAAVNSQSGPGRLALNNVVLANFTLSSPGTPKSPVLWPKGILQPGLQPGSTVPRKLYMTDVKIVVSAQSIQEYVRFFSNSSSAIYTDNATFVHVPYWSDEQTTAISVGLLLGGSSLEPQELAGTKPLANRNFILAADMTTLLPVLQSGPAVRTSTPFLMYLSANVSVTTAKLRARSLPINRPLYLVGKSTDPTGVDFGMEVNTLQLGPLGSIFFNELVLENLAPGDERSIALAGPFEVLMSYHIWAVGFDRATAESPRLMLVNCTLVVSTMAVEQYLFKATLYRVRPAGFDRQLEQLKRYVSRWEVMWVEDSDSVATEAFMASAISFLGVNVTAQPTIAVALPLPDRTAIASSASPHALSEYQLTHVGESGLHTMQLGPFGGADPKGLGARELIMLTTNVTFKPDGTPAAAAAAASLTSPAAVVAPEGALYRQLRQFLANNLVQGSMQQHVLMGIVTPPVTLDLAYTQNFVQLPPALPPGYFGLVNMVALHLSQGPRAASADATVLLPDVWTHLLWSIQRTSKNVVMLSNVTLWVPAAEFSFIRSHTTEQPTSFTINLQGDMNMRFYNVRDLRADGLFIQHYLGPGLEAQSLTLRVEPGWSQNGQPPRGFWATSAQPAPDPPENNPNRLSDAMVVVLAACLVTAVVASVLACLAFVFWRKRVAESQAQRAAAAADEDGFGGKSGSEAGSHSQPPSHYGSTGHRSNTGSGSHRSGSGMGVYAGPLSLRSPGIMPGLLRDSMPVHDSSDSYNIPEAVDRAALTAELARSHFGRRNLAQQPGNGSSGSDNSSAGAGGRGKFLPPAAAAVNFSNTSAASDACFQRLQSAITILSQDVLSRRLQCTVGPEGGAAGASAAVGGLARPSPLGLTQNQQQQQQWLMPPPEAVPADGAGQQPHSGSLLGRRSSSSLGRGSIHADSPVAAAAAAMAAAADPQLREGSLVAAGDELQQQGQPRVAAGQAQPQGPWGAAVWAGAGAAAAGGGGGGVGGGGAALSKSSMGSSTSRMGSSGGMEQLKLLQLVGQGTFGQVYKALWRRRCVAVKVLQLPATAGSSDVPWRGMGRASSHREKMAVMETVVSTTMSHPNIVQVYTYVLQPLMQGSMPRSRKQLDGTQSPKQRKLQLQDQEQSLLPEQPLLQQQQQQRPVQPREIELQPQPQPQAQQQQHQQPQPPSIQQPLQVQGAAAQLIARFSGAAAQQQQQPPQPASQLPPDPGAAEAAQQAAGVQGAAAANGGGGGGAGMAAEAQQQQQQQQQWHQSWPQVQQLEQQMSGSVASSRSRHGSACDDSSQLLTFMTNAKDLSRLTPEMAKAAAAALPAAAGAAADGAGPRRSSSGTGDDGAEGVEGSGDADLHQGPVLVGWELRLVMEFCDAGSLRTALDHKLLIDRTTGLPALECVLFLAHDVACAMIHLHSEHLLHGDLKASNVLLKRTAPRLPTPSEQPSAVGGAAAAAASTRRASQGGHHRHTSQAGSLIGQGLGLMAKVADFGLSLTLGPTDTHVSQMHMGTLTHMAPELLLHGHASKASDVFAFGILLWELTTGRRPYSGTPVGMLAHKVVQQCWRPAWPGGCSLPVQMLVESCWMQEPADRPSFEQVVQQLEDMAEHLEELKQQQAQTMAAAAAPLFHPAAGGHHDSDPGHELTPSMMAELMPSGFSGGSGPSDIQEEEHVSGVVYEMSQLSGGSQDRGLQLALGSDEDADAAVMESFDLNGMLQAAAARPAACTGGSGQGGGVDAIDGSHGSGSRHGGRVGVVQ